VNVQISPSILSADFTRLAEEIKAVEEAGADMLHLDIMDGHFVPNITFGPPVVAAIKSVATVPLDVHLMIKEPDAYIDDFASAGADILTVHVEACTHLQGALRRIRDKGMRAAASLNPSTPVESLGHVLEDLDMALLMSVNPGFSGQKFIPQVMGKITQARRLVGEEMDIQVDGGVTPANAGKVVRAGANILVAGSAVFSTDDYAKAIKALRQTGTRK
jgi:ribulose-phosphate 3-epimerase